MLHLILKVLTIFFDTSNTWASQYVLTANGFTHPIFSELMNVLVIGDEHTYGYGLSEGNLGYIGHFIRNISRAGRAVSVEAYAHLTMTQIGATLAQLPLNQYDLIILQLDQTLIQTATAAHSAGVTMPILSDPNALCRKATAKKIRNHLTIVKDLLLSFIVPHRATASISGLLRQLRPYRHNVLLLTPFPKMEPVSDWLRKRSRAVLLQEADKQLVSVFDTDSIIRPREEYFLSNDKAHLNAVSHELLGRSLFDFYQSAPTIVTIQAFRRE